VVERWIRSRVRPVGAIEVAHERPWATVLRVPVVDGSVWFKACGAVQAFEPRLTASLFQRWPDRVAEVLDVDCDLGWLLLADGGVPVGERGNPPEAWLAALPAYAELQRGEAAHASDHLAHGVPDLRVETLPARLDELLRGELPLTERETHRLRGFGPRFSDLCHQLSAHDIASSIQHDDLHHNNLYERDGQLRVLDWGDSSISHPFASLVVTFRFLEEVTKLEPDDPWFARLRDAYLEPWGAALTDTFEIAFTVGTFAHAFAWARQRDHLPQQERAEFDKVFRIVLRRALVHAELKGHP
jgi:Phosphotransferase enzyme family